MFDNVGDSPGGRPNYGLAKRHRFQENEAEALAGARQREHVGVRVARRSVDRR